MEKSSRMRKILFKAKRINNGEWVEGDLIIGTENNGNEICQRKPPESF